MEDVVVIAENGQMAIHLPLTTARIGGFSTHTAHPEFVRMMGKLLSTLLDYPIRIENPFLYMTKAEVVAAVAGGLLTVDEDCQRYTLSLEEFTGWQRAVDRSGMPGLRVTRIKHYRDQYERQQRY